MVWSCRMPSDIMDQRHMSSLYRPSLPSSFSMEEAQFPSEKQVGFWKTASMPGNHGLEAMTFVSGGKAVSSSPLEKIRLMGGNYVDCLELPPNLFKDPKRNTPHNFEHQFIGAKSTVNCCRAPDQDASFLYGQPASLSAENKRVTLNVAHHENVRLSSDAFVGQAANTTQPDFVVDEAFASLEEIEAQTIGDLLPDDDDLLSGAIHDLGYAAQSNKTDVEDDLFCSVGGMELESNDNFSFTKVSEYDYGGAFNSLGMGLNNLPTSNLPYGERSSRTLFVRNVDSNMEDMELRAFFEQYGDIRSLYTYFRHRGFIMVSYYDIRAAESAVRVFQTKSIRGQKLDIQFCISKDNPSEKDINEGVLLVTNLEPSISNDDLLHIFGVYGEIKEIFEISCQEHHKLIEFYDVRAAEGALLALNRRDIAGKRIKVEPCGLRDTGFSVCSSMQQILSANLEEESRRCGPESYSHKLSSECFVPSGLMTLGADTSSGLHKLSSPVRVAMVGNQGNQCDLSHSLGQMNLGYQSLSTFPCDGAISHIPFNFPSTMSAMTMSVGSTLAKGVDNRNTQRVGSAVHSSPSFEQNEAVFNISGNGSCPLKSHEYIWNNSNVYHPHHPGSMWQNLPQFMNNIPAQTPQVHGLARGPSHMPNPVLPHQHVGSAPTMDPLLWNRRHSFSGDATSFHPSSLGNVGYSRCSPVHPLELGSHSIFPHASGTCIDPSIATAHVGVLSPHQRSHIFRGRNNVNSTPNSHDTPHDRIRGRRSDAIANQADSRKQYELDIDRIIRRDDSRTTLMIKNIPNKYTSKMLLATIDEQHKGTYDFIYLPIDFKNKCNVGYAFINMTDPQHIIPFYQAFNGKKWEKFNSEKVAYLAYARIQGKSALIAHFQNSSLMNEDKRCRPILFHSDGPNAGDQEPFPVGVNIRSRRSRTNTDNHQGSPSGSSSGDESSCATGSSSGSGKDS